MVLDMYLSRRQYVKNWNHTRSEDRFQGVAFKGNVAIDLSKLTQLEFEVMYWRKVNAIHQWFVDNVQGGNDNCEEYYVDREILEKLITTIEHVLEHKDDAEKLLPTAEGFFFGSDEMDEYYWDQLHETRWTLKEAIEKHPNDDYYYRASW